jgi:hypothetical protein
LQISSLKRAPIAREVFVVDAAGNDVGDCFLALRKVSDGLLAVTTRRCMLALGKKERKKRQGKCKGKRDGIVYAMGMIGCTGIPVVSKGTVEVI